MCYLRTGKTLEQEFKDRLQAMEEPGSPDPPACLRPTPSAKAFPEATDRWTVVRHGFYPGIPLGPDLGVFQPGVSARHHELCSRQSSSDRAKVIRESQVHRR